VAAATTAAATKNPPWATNTPTVTRTTIPMWFSFLHAVTWNEETPYDASVGGGAHYRRAHPVQGTASLALSASSCSRRSNAAGRRGILDDSAEAELIDDVRHVDSASKLSLLSFIIFSFRENGRAFKFGGATQLRRR